ncbi:MAG: T9SS type A sorting domain-containing protein [Candidatus Oleimicrobiaceae bacterium]
MLDNKVITFGGSQADAGGWQLSRHARPQENKDREAQEMVKANSKLELDFLYLVRLTEAGLKPLSRWVKPLPDEGWALLRRAGLEAVRVSRCLLNGGTTTELVFGRKGAPIELYWWCFAGTALDRSPATQRLEGFLFGYPPCCVEAFVHHGYQPNNLAEEDQRLLFHWACPDCAITPSLVPFYRKVYERCEEELGRRSWRNMKWPKFAAAAAMVATLSGAALDRLFAQDAHWLPLAPPLDRNGNYLLDREEEGLLGLSADSTAHALAAEVMAAIDRLPEGHTAGATYLEHFPLWGVEKCSVCGAEVNMGCVVITNDAHKESITLPYISLHYLAHGSFSFSGELHQGRVHLLRLLRILGLSDRVHLLRLPPEVDGEDDGLPDASEERLAFSALVADTDGNGVVDGLEVSLNWAAEINALPSVCACAPPADRVYRVEHQAKGLEACSVCGALVNMGCLEIVNPMERFVVEMPYIALHYLEHGSFAYEGSVHGRGLEEPRAIDCALRSPGGYHQLAVEGDSDGDGLRDNEEATLGTNPAVPDSDGDGLSDGTSFAWRLYEAVQGLPSEPREDGPYVRHMMVRGVEQCTICGQWVNMGYMRVINPALNDSLDLPYIGLHALEHGAFTYDGTLHSKGRLDPLRLAQLLDLKTKVEGGPPDMPGALPRLAAYPNPFNSFTVISYELAEPGMVELAIYNLLGQKVRTLVKGLQAAEAQVVSWDATDDHRRTVPAGIYYCRIRAREAQRTIKMAYLP